MAESEYENKQEKESKLLTKDLLSENISTESEVVWLDAHPECSVCLQPCLQPVQLPCLHIFCFLCSKGFVFRSKRCALCRSAVTFEYFDKPTIVKMNACHSPTTPKDEKYDWFYEGRNGWWQYDQRASSILEDAFTSEARSCEVNIAGFIYLINFENMVQFRKSHPARCRRIKRDKVGVDRKGIAGLKVKSKANIHEESELQNDTKDVVDKTLHTNSNSGMNANSDEDGSRTSQSSDITVDDLATDMKDIL